MSEKTTTKKKKNKITKKEKTGETKAGKTATKKVSPSKKKQPTKKKTIQELKKEAIPTYELIFIVAPGTEGLGKKINDKLSAAGINTDILHRSKTENRKVLTILKKEFDFLNDQIGEYQKLEWGEISVYMHKQFVEFDPEYFGDKDPLPFFTTTIGHKIKVFNDMACDLYDSCAWLGGLTFPKDWINKVNSFAKNGFDLRCLISDIVALFSQLDVFDPDVYRLFFEYDFPRTKDDDACLGWFAVALFLVSPIVFGKIEIEGRREFRERRMSNEITIGQKKVIRDFLYSPLPEDSKSERCVSRIAEIVNCQVDRLKLLFDEWGIKHDSEGVILNGHELEEFPNDYFSVKLSYSPDNLEAGLQMFIHRNNYSRLIEKNDLSTNDITEIEEMIDLFIKRFPEESKDHWRDRG